MRCGCELSLRRLMWSFLSVLAARHVWVAAKEVLAVNLTGRDEPPMADRDRLAELTATTVQTIGQ